jgi:hypothetical protein
MTVTEAGKPVKPQVACAATLAGHPLQASGHSASITGKATCLWQLPRTARGKRLRGSIRASYLGSKVTRSFSVEVA